AVQIGDLCGYGYGPGTKIHYTPLGFSSANRGAPDTARDAVAFTENSVPIRDEPIQGHELLQRKKKLFPGFPSTVSEFGCVTHLVPRTISVSGWENINPIPFRSAARQTRACVSVSEGRLASERSFLRSLRTDEPLFNCCHMEHLSASSSRLALSLFATTTKICTGGGSRRAHARHLQRTPPRPSYSLRRKPPPRGKLSVAARIAQRWSVIHCQG
ncbi:hypothetical protein JTE90_013628, partial [Oedothorax gibbosus]